MNEENIKLIKEIEKYAEEYDIPIMMKSGIDFLTNFVKENNIKTILEVGTAIGYSSIMMALVDPNIKIKTIERDEKRYLEAIKNIKKFSLEDRITLIFNDASLVNIEEKYDLVFIDAAKGQNINFFNKFSSNLNNNGFIVTDNINFHGLVDKDLEDIKSRNLRGLIRKIQDYTKFLKENKEYKTVFYDIGDGISISSKNN
ncbi:MAG: O-methyltransferase [Bacilli bacterium]|nr:O-methyltransferase [Bacilli bacterium]